MISGRKYLLMNKHLSHGDRHKTVSCEGWRWMGQVALRDDYWVPRGPFCPQEVCRANMMNLEVGQVCRYVVLLETWIKDGTWFITDVLRA